jgi:hypothetical protein
MISIGIGNCVVSRWVVKVGLCWRRLSFKHLVEEILFKTLYNILLKM